MQREHAFEPSAPVPKSMIVVPAITTYVALAACMWAWPQLLALYCVAVLASAFVCGLRGSKALGFREAAGLVRRSWHHVGMPPITPLEHEGAVGRLIRRVSRSMLAFWLKQPVIWLVAAVMAPASMFHREEAGGPAPLLPPEDGGDAAPVTARLRPTPPARRAQNARRFPR